MASVAYRERFFQDHIRGQIHPPMIGVQHCAVDERFQTLRSAAMIGQARSRINAHPGSAILPPIYIHRRAAGTQRG